MILAVQASELDAFINGDPFRILIGLVLFMIFGLFGILMLFSRTTNGMMKETQQARSDDSKAFRELMRDVQMTIAENNSQQNRQESQALDLVKTSMTDLVGALNRLTGKLEDREDKAGEDQIYTNTYLERISESVQKMSTDTIKAIGTIVIEANQMHSETRLFVMESMQRLEKRGEEQLANYRAFSIMQANFQFPLENDCRWQIKRVKSKRSDNKAPIWRTPMMTDISATSAYVSNGEGEIIRIISHTAWKGWHAVIKIDNPEQRGWIDADLVEVFEVAPTPKRITDEQRKVILGGAEKGLGEGG